MTFVTTRQSSCKRHGSVLAAPKVHLSYFLHHTSNFAIFASRFYDTTHAQECCFFSFDSSRVRECQKSAGSSGGIGDWIALRRLLMAATARDMARRLRSSGGITTT